MSLSDDPFRWRVGLVGYGEVGQILAEDLRGKGVAVAMYDLKLGTDAGARMRQHAAEHGVQIASSHGLLAANVDLLISAVTASQAVPAAQACAGSVATGSFFLDFNSASPSAKIRAAGFVDGAGGRYVEGAVMTSVPPYRIRVPLLLGGPHAAALGPGLSALGFDAKLSSQKLGIASATKMCRIRRVIEHGRRRAEEMLEAAQTVREAGLEPWSAGATAQRQAWVADLVERGVLGGEVGEKSAGRSNWRADADRILAAADVAARRR